MEKNNLPFIGDVIDLKGKYVLLRSSLNVPITDGVVVNQFRLLRGLTTIQYLVSHGARVVLCGHLSNTKATEQIESLEPVFTVLAEHVPITFAPTIATPDTKSQLESMTDGSVVLLENLRQDPREKKNDADFARCLADLADIYVNDAFAVAHRSHASVVGVPQFIPSYIGHNFKHEYEELHRSLTPEAPALFILGGAKFDTKMPLIEKYLEVYDHVFVGGALANDLFKARGYETGESLLSDVDSATLLPLLEHPSLLLPTDVTVTGPDGTRVTVPDDVAPTETIVDAGPGAIAALDTHVVNAKTILWNGPLGNYEVGFDQYTKELAKRIAQSNAYSIVGGGDTVASIEALNCQEQYGFLSTAGGAMLHFLEHGALPAIDAIADQPAHD